MSTYTIRPSNQEDVLNSLMSKAQFNALAAERRANRAGSGFDEFGKHLTTNPYVNEGLWCFTTLANKLGIGYSGTPGSTLSKTYFPISNINGVNLNITGIFDGYTDINIITLPPAPTVLPYDAVLTTEQIAMGVIKHADSSNSGLIVNGKFTTGTSGWFSSPTVSTTWENGKARQIATASNDFYQGFSTVVGKSYTIYIDLTHNSGAYPYVFIQNSSFSTIVSTSTSSSGIFSLNFVATTTTTYVILRAPATTDVSYDNIAVFPADAISRSDLVFLESWHEDVSEKDFVYPLGNVQYLGGVTDGMSAIVTGAFSGSGTYSLFGNWQASGALVGKGYVWSYLTDAQKKAFVSNPENNCYLDGDKVIQVRYRIRVVAGMGDSWNNTQSVQTTNGGTALTLRYSSTGNISNDSYLVPTGKSTTVRDINVGYLNGMYHDLGSSNSAYNPSGFNYIGAFQAVTSAWGLSTTFGYEGKCYALPIALGGRRNLGMYHPTYNDNGTKKASDGNFWYNTSVSFTSIADCFDSSKLLTASGYIGTTSGRPDGLFYDQVHESDIIDLRMNSAKVEDYNRLIDREFNKLVAGTYRGSEGEHITNGYEPFYTYWFNSGQLGIYVTTGTNSIIAKSSEYKTVEQFTSQNPTLYFTLASNGTTYTATFMNNQSGYAWYSISPAMQSMTAGAQDIQMQMYYKGQRQTTRTKSNTLTHCDIIGSPANYPTAWKQSGVSGVPLVVAEDGSSLLPTGSLTTFKLSRKANATPLQVLKSTDSGATWTALTVTTHYTFNTTTNVLTMVTAPATTDLIMVTYQTHTSMATPAANTKAIIIGGTCRGWNTIYNAHLMGTLIGKVPVSAISANGKVATVLGWNVAPFWDTTEYLAGTGSYGESPTHSAMVFTSNDNAAVKTFPYLTRSNGKARLQLVFKEMKHNGTSWGDHDNTFNIVDNVSTTTDGNGETILIGQKYAELPYFIGGGE